MCVKDAAQTQIRCKRCNRLLLKGQVKNIEIKCPKCGCLQNFNVPCNCHK